MKHLWAMAAPLALLGGCGAPEESETAAAAGDEAVSAAMPSPAATRLVPVPVAFAQCRSCHSVVPGKKGIGPTLAGVMGRKAGSLPGFNYSPALKKSGITWDAQTMDEWLAGPVKMVPGSRMLLTVHRPDQRQKIIEYLEALD